MSDWVILHGGALGDLTLTIQLALRLPDVGEGGGLHVVSRTDPGDLSACRPSIRRRSSEGLGLHWLFGDHDDPPPARLAQLLRGARVLNALAGAHTIVHKRLLELAPAALYSLDPRPRAGASRHITQQWQTQLEQQNLLVPKCIHQQPAHRVLGVPDALRRAGAALLRQSRAAPDSATEAPADTAGPTVVIHPGSGGRAKCWPRSGFLEVARRLCQERRATVCFLVGPVELETWSAAELVELAGEFPLLRGPTPNELVAILSAADVLIGNDAGPTHLAALLGTPTVALFGPTPVSVWRPLGVGAHVMAGDPRSRPDTWGIQPGQVAALALTCL
jgi:hypothetical protein